MNKLIFIRQITLAFYLSLAGFVMAAPIQGTLYKNPQCGCCTGHANYLREQGFDIKIVATHDLPSIKQQYNVSTELEGCHTLLIDDYVIEGHVPVNTIKRLLTERPDIKGISLPGMPMGSPGMGGKKQQPFAIFELSEGSPKVFAVE